MIEVESLVKTYGLNPVLRGINLTIPAGQALTLVGPNGAGKTTMMRIVATLLAPSSGSVNIGGWPLPRHAQRVRPHIGLVSHQSLLYGDLTAAENLAFFGQLYGAAAQRAAKSSRRCTGSGWPPGRGIRCAPSRAA